MKGRNERQSKEYFHSSVQRVEGGGMTGRSYNPQGGRVEKGLRPIEETQRENICKVRREGGESVEE